MLRNGSFRPTEKCGIESPGISNLTSWWLGASVLCRSQRNLIGMLLESRPSRTSRGLLESVGFNVRGR